MSFPTHSAPCFTWHLPTDSLVFCAPALLLLGLTPETAPRTMADFLDRLPEPQRHFLQRQRQMALTGKTPGCLSCSYTYNGRHIREDLNIIQCDAEGRPQTILGTFDLRDEVSLPVGEDGGYWTYIRKEGELLLDARCAGLLGLASGAGPLDRASLRRLRRLYRAAGSLARLRRWLDIPLCSGRQSLLLMPSRSEELPLLLTASVLHRDRDGRALVVSGSLAPFLAGKAAPVGGADRLLLAMDACSDGLWDWDATTGKVYYSQNYLSMLGHTPETYPAELDSWVRSVHPDDYEKTVNMQMRVAASPAEGDAFSCTYRIRRADGSWLWVLGRGCVTSRDSQGRALRIVGMHTDISSLQHDRNVLEKKIRLDPLTGVYNRYHLDGLLQQVRKDRGPLSVLMADVNGLKMINDHLGHHTGDELLRTAAQQLLKHIRQEDCLARLGGDEFVMVLSCPCDVVRERLSTIRKALDAWNAAGGLPLELSFGLAGSDDGSVAPEILLRQADARMMEEKKQVRAASHARIRAWLEARTGRKVPVDDPRL